MTEADPGWSHWLMPTVPGADWTHSATSSPSAPSKPDCVHKREEHENRVRLVESEDGSKTADEYARVAVLTMKSGR